MLANQFIKLVHRSLQAGALRLIQPPPDGRGLYRHACSPCRLKMDQTKPVGVRERLLHCRIVTHLRESSQHPILDLNAHTAGRAGSPAPRGGVLRDNAGFLAGTRLAPEEAPPPLYMASYHSFGPQSPMLCAPVPRDRHQHRTVGNSHLKGRTWLG